MFYVHALFTFLLSCEWLRVIAHLQTTLGDSITQVMRSSFNRHFALGYFLSISRQINENYPGQEGSAKLSKSNFLYSG